VPADSVNTFARLPVMRNYSSKLKGAISRPKRIAAISNIDPQGDAVFIQLPETHTGWLRFHSVTMDSLPVAGKKVPGHDPLRHNTLPPEIPVAPFPRIADATDARVLFVSPAKMYMSKWSLRSGEPED